MDKDNITDVSKLCIIRELFMFNGLTKNVDRCLHNPKENPYIIRFT